MGAVKKALKPVTKFVDRIVPNEIKPALPFVAATFGAPYLAGSGLLGGIGNLALKKGLAGGALNLGTQALLGQKISPMSALFSAGTIGGGQFLKGSPGFIGPPTGIQKVLGDVGSVLSPDKIGSAGLTTLGEIGKAATVPAVAGGTKSAYDAAEQANREYEEYLASQEAAGAEDIQSRVDFITSYMSRAGYDQDRINETLNNMGYAANGGLMGTRVGFEIGGMSDVGKFFSKITGKKPTEKSLMDLRSRYAKEIENEMVSELGEDYPSVETLNKIRDEANKRADVALNNYMESLGMDPFNPPEGTIGSDVIEQIMGPRKEGRVEEANGGRIKKSIGGLAFAYDDYLRQADELGLSGDPMSFEDFTDTWLELQSDLGNSEKYKNGGRIGFKDGGYDPAVGSKEQYKEYLEDIESDIISPDTSFNEWIVDNAPEPDYDYSYKKGGRAGYAGGGLMNLKMGGMPAEMDLRPGGFVPLGAKERADDVPARLSKNEFVMTADAVRAAGGGSVNKGAKRMYDLMNKLEARA